MHVFGDPASLELLRSFGFYKNRILANAYSGPIGCDTASGAFVFSGVVSRELFRAPKSATHVRIRAAIVVLDFDGKSYAVFKTPEYIGMLENSMLQPELTCDLTMAGAGFRMGIVALEFFQKKNGELYVLAEGRSLGVV